MGGHRNGSYSLHNGFENGAHLLRIGVTDGVWHHDFLRASLCKCDCVLDHIGNRYTPLIRAPERGGQATDKDGPGLCGLRAHQFNNPDEIRQ